MIGESDLGKYFYLYPHNFIIRTYIEVIVTQPYKISGERYLKLLFRQLGFCGPFQIGQVLRPASQEVLGDFQIVPIEVHPGSANQQRPQGDHLSYGIVGRNLRARLLADMVVQAQIGIPCISFTHVTSLPALAVAITFRQFSVSFE